MQIIIRNKTTQQELTFTSLAELRLFLESARENEKYALCEVNLPEGYVFKEPVAVNQPDIDVVDDSVVLSLDTSFRNKNIERACWLLNN